MVIAPAAEHYWLSAYPVDFWARMADPDTVLACVERSPYGALWNVTDADGNTISGGHELLGAALDVAEREGEILAMADAA